MATKRIHLATEKGGRSRCRYTSRPSIRPLFVSLERFRETPKENRCKECAAKLKSILNNLDVGREPDSSSDLVD